MRQVKTLGLLGTGVIGGGWAARALHFGIDVIAADVKPEMEEWIRGAVANAERRAGAPDVRAAAAQGHGCPSRPTCMPWRGRPTSFRKTSPSSWS